MKVFRNVLKSAEGAYSRKLNRHESKHPAGKSQQVIDVDTYLPKITHEPKKPHPVWIKNTIITLRKSDLEILQENQWLNDDIINAAQSLLKHQFRLSSGFQSTACLQALSLDVEQGEFSQIVHNGSDHWLVVSTVGAVHP